VSVAAPANAYTVEERREDDGWVVLIVEPSGRVVSARACGDETEAHTYASTVRQHAYWLSEEKFREYYRLPGPGEEA
jgi:hypothetical protein